MSDLRFLRDLLARGISIGGAMSGARDGPPQQSLLLVWKAQLKAFHHERHGKKLPTARSASHTARYGISQILL
ncbi:hypothetical protein DMENIID0001_121770 [Sergentomyia squamirostris]